MPSNLQPPPLKAPLIDPSGIITPIWADFFKQLRLRTGEGSAYTNTELAADDFVTFARMQNIATDKIIGRDTAATGSPEEIGVGGGIEFTGSGALQTSAFTGDVTKAAGGTDLTIANDAVSFVKMLSNDWTKSTGASGYTKLPNGVYIQWGETASINSGTNTSVNFPTAFPNACRQVIPGIKGNSATATTTTGQYGADITSVSAFTMNNRTSVANVFTFIAVGF